MNKSNHPDQEPGDQDIDQLFKTQNIEFPAAIDSNVLAASRNSLASTPKAKTSWLGSGHSSFFAMAAMLVVGIGIIPLLLKSPELSPSVITEESDSVSANNTAAPASFAAPQSASDDAVEPSPQGSPSAQSSDESVSAMQSQSLEGVSGNNMTNTQLNSSHAGAEVLQESVSELAAEAIPEGVMDSVTFESAEVKPDSNVAALKASRTQSIAENAADSDADQESGAPATSYRNAPDTWLNRIKVLSFDGDRIEAEKEYKMFRQQYPDFEKNYQLKIRDMTPTRQIPADPGSLKE